MENTRTDSNVENIVIIGSGPAGYTAAIYAARANLQPLLVTGFNSGGIPGGQLMTTTFVENYPGFPDGVLGPELMDLMKAQAERWGTNLYESDVVSINTDVRPFELETLDGTIKANSIIIALAPVAIIIELAFIVPSKVSNSKGRTSVLIETTSLSYKFVPHLSA